MNFKKIPGTRKYLGIGSFMKKQVILTAAKVPFQIRVETFTKYSPFSTRSSSLHVMVLHFAFLQFFQGKQQGETTACVKKYTVTIGPLISSLKFYYSVPANWVLAHSEEHVVLLLSKTDAGCVRISTGGTPALWVKNAMATTAIPRGTAVIISSAPLSCGNADLTCTHHFFQSSEILFLEGCRVRSFSYLQWIYLSLTSNTSGLGKGWQELNWLTSYSKMYSCHNNIYFWWHGGCEIIGCGLCNTGWFWNLTDYVF